MALGEPVALDTVDPRDCDVEQHVHQMVGQEVDLVDVEHPSVGAGEQSWAERVGPGPEQRGDVECSDHAVLARPERKLDERRASGQQRSQPPSERGLRGPFVPPQQHAAEARLYGRQQKRQLRVVLADHGGEGKVRAHRDSSQPSASSSACRSMSAVSPSGFHRPRSSASKSRSTMERSAQGLDCSKSSRFSGSAT